MESLRCAVDHTLVHGSDATIVLNAACSLRIWYIRLQLDVQEAHEEALLAQEMVDIDTEQARPPQPRDPVCSTP